VTETSQGPGCWQASNGEWFPPKADLMVAPNWHQGEQGQWLPPTGSEGGAPGWWVSVDGAWYPPESHPDFAIAHAPHERTSLDTTAPVIDISATDLPHLGTVNSTSSTSPARLFRK
jgi:hypothetical protein